MAKPEVTKERESVTFYSWIDSYPQAVPSSLLFHVSGGQRRQDPNTGAIMPLDHKEVRFNMGILRTDDPEAIAELRKVIKKGETMTEDREVYLAKIMKPEDTAKRAVKLLASEREGSAEKDRRILELEAQLAGKK